MFKLVLHLKRDSNNSYPSDVTFAQTEGGHLEIDLGDRKIVVHQEDISDLRKLLDLHQET